eukprot:c29690_g1_i1 orf=333-770(+)
MPRRSSGKPARSAPRPTAARRSAPPPVAHHAPPPAQPSGGGSLLGGMAGTIAQGMAFGTGSAVAHRAVDSLMGPRVVQHEHSAVESPTAEQIGSPALTTVGGMDLCGNHAKSFQDCLSMYTNDIGKCQFYLDMLNECRKGSSVSL